MYNNIRFLTTVCSVINEISQNKHHMNHNANISNFTNLT